MFSGNAKCEKRVTFILSTRVLFCLHHGPTILIVQQKKKKKKQETSNETRAFILISKNVCSFSSCFLWSNVKLTGYKRA